MTDIDFYCKYYDLFEIESLELRRKILGEAEGTPHLPTAPPLETGSNFKKKLAELFIEMAQLNAASFYAGTEIAIAANQENPKELRNSFLALTAFDNFLRIFTIANDFYARKKQQKFLQKQGIEETLSLGNLLLESVKKNKTDVIMTTLNNVGTVLSLLPDPTFATKAAAAIIFMGMGFYSLILEAMNIHHTSKVLAVLKNHQEAPRDEEVQTYEVFMKKIIQTTDNPLLLEAFLTAGEILKNADFDFHHTRLPAEQWKALAEKTLKFNRGLQIINCIKSFFNVVITVFLTLPSTIASIGIKAAQAIGKLTFIKKLALPSMITSASLGVSNVVQTFSQKGIFQHFILNKVPFTDHIEYAEHHG